MSFGQQDRSTESWNNDPNSFTNSGPGGGFQNQDQPVDGSGGKRFGSTRQTDDAMGQDGLGSSGGGGGGGGGQGFGQDEFQSGDPGEKFGTSGYGRSGMDTAGTGMMHESTDMSGTGMNNEPSTHRGFDRSGNPQVGVDHFGTASQANNFGSPGYDSGNRTDANNVGTGGNFGSSGRGGGADSDNWRRNDNSNNNEQTSGSGKASMGDRLMGNAEKMAGCVTGNPGMVERGQVCKSGNPDDTSYNSESNDNY